MKTFLACLIAGAVVWLGFTTFATAGQQAVTPKQFAALSKRVAALEKANKAVLGYVAACFVKWTPLTVYGGPTQGYLYKFSDGTEGTVTGIDLTALGGGAASFYVPSAAQDCSLTSPRFRTLAGSGHRGTLNLSPHARG